jgi:hypothetical protein
MLKKLVFMLLAMLLTVPMAEAAGGTFNYDLPSLSIRLRTEIGRAHV